MAKPREKLSSQADPELLAALREVVQGEGRQFQAVLQGARMAWAFGGMRLDLIA